MTSKTKKNEKASQLRRLYKMGCWWNVDHWRVPTLWGMVDKKTRAEAIAQLDQMEAEHGKEWWLKEEELRAQA